MDFQYRDILLNDAQLGPYPLEKLKRVDKPTTEYVGEHKSRSVEESGMNKAIASEAGKKIRETGIFFNDRDPLCSAYTLFENHIAQFKGAPLSDEKAPLPDDPGILSRHIKSLAYFTGADMVGICKLPESVLYTEALNDFGEDAFYKYAIVLLNVKKRNVYEVSVSSLRQCFNFRRA